MLPNHGHHNLQRLKIAYHLEDAHGLEQSGQTCQLEGWTENVDDGKYREQVDNGHRGNWVNQKSYPGLSLRIIIGSDPTKYIVDDIADAGN